MQPLILPYKGILPRISPSAFIAPGSAVIGDVEIGENTNVWFNCVIRGDVNKITIGANTNVQDGTVIHVNRGDGPTVIGCGVTIGHMALLHACIVEDNSFIGMGATVMDFAKVSSGSMLAAGALLAPGKIIPEGELWAGRPAKLMRNLTPEEKNYIQVSADNYVQLALEYK